MKPVLFYLLQVMVASAILYGYYHLALRNKKFHRYNRFYLLGAILISVLVPFLNIPIYFTASETSSSPVLQTLTILSNSGGDTISPVSRQNINRSTWFTRENLIYAGYALIALLALIRIFFSLHRIRKIASSNPVEKLNDIYFVNTAEPGTPFSFFKWLFWNNKIELRSLKGEQIFRHEIFHIRQKHSLDIIFLELLTVVFWINPFYHLMKKEIKAIHEFLADKFAVNEDQKWDYAELLLMRALNTQQHLVNPFFHNQIKRRIAMITTSSKPGHQYLRKLMVLPIAATVALLFAFSYKTKENNATLIHIDSLMNPTMVFNNAMQVTILDSTPVTKMITKDFEPPIIPKVNPGEKLVVIDEQIRGVTRNVNASGSWMGLKQDEIESIAFLKDASAKAKYGKIGEYGVIEITTKKHVNTLNDTIPGKIAAKSVYYDGRNKIILESDSIIWKTHPNNTKINTVSALLIVNGEKTKNDIFSEKTFISKRMIIYSANDPEAVKRYGKDAANGVIVMEEARSINTPTREYYKKELEATAKKQVPDPNNKVFDRVEIEPSFPGGEEKWKKYLGIYLNEHIPASTGCPPGEYTVIVQFIVQLDGSITDLKALTKHGYGMEKNAIDLIRNGPRWVPAIQNGQQVIAYKKQPVTFVIKKDISAKDYNNPENWNLNDPEFMKWRQEAIMEVLSIARKEGKAAYYYKGRTYVFAKINEAEPEHVNTYFEADGVTKQFVLNGNLIHSIDEINARYRRKDIKSIRLLFPVQAKEKYNVGGGILEIQTFDGELTTLPESSRNLNLNQITVENLRKSNAYSLLKVDPGTEIVSYSLAIDLDNGNIGEGYNKGNQFSDATRTLIQNANSGKTITIDNIRIMNDGKEKKVPSKVYYVID